MTELPTRVREMAVNALYKARDNGKVMDEAAEAVARVVYDAGYSAGYGECMREWQTSR